MENEFDFFNQLSLSDLDRSRLGGYGTFDYTAPIANINTASNTNLNTGIKTVAPINMIPAPIKPFINQNIGNNNDGGIPTLKKSTYNAILEDEVNQKDLEDAKKDTNVSNLLNMGLINQAQNYVKNNYGYMIMNAIFPGSGIVAKGIVENKKKKEAKREEQERIEKQAIEKARKEKEMQDIIRAAEKEAETIAKARAANAAVYASAERQGYTGSGGGFSTSAEDRAGTSVGSGQFSPSTSRGRSGYGKGGIVTL